ncbi:MAG: hypothetical protein ACK55Z_09905, partial [bacterium]
MTGESERASDHFLLSRRVFASLRACAFKGERACAITIIRDIHVDRRPTTSRERLTLQKAAGKVASYRRCGLPHRRSLSDKACRESAVAAESRPYW